MRAFPGKEIFICKVCKITKKSKKLLFKHFLVSHLNKKQSVCYICRRRIGNAFRHFEKRHEKEVFSFTFIKETCLYT